MKVPKLIKKHCPKCRKHTEHKVTESKKRSPNSAHPLAKAAKPRTGFGKGVGNLGRYGSRPPINKFKMTGQKTTKKTDLRYTCAECQKTQSQRKGKRTKRVELV